MFGRSPKQCRFQGCDEPAAKGSKYCQRHRDKQTRIADTEGRRLPSKGTRAKAAELRSPVFISYAQEFDSIEAQRVVRHLEKRGIRCWIASRDIRPGTRYPDSIDLAIHQARVLVVLLSDGVLYSDHIPREVETAVRYGLVVIPLELERVELTGALSYLLATTQRVDASGARFTVALDALTHEVQRALSGEIDYAGRDSRGPAQLSEMRERLLSAHTVTDLRRLRHETEAALAVGPRNAELRLLREQVVRAIDSESQREQPSAVHRVGFANDISGLGLIILAAASFVIFLIREAPWALWLGSMALIILPFLIGRSRKRRGRG